MRSLGQSDASATARSLPSALEDGEVVGFGLAFAVFLYACVAFARNARVRHRGVLLAALGALVLGTFFTNLEELVSERPAALLNLAEHLAYLGHVALLGLYALRTTPPRRRTE